MAGEDDRHSLESIVMNDSERKYESMFCPRCGKPIPDESIFCMHCGKPMTGETRSINETPPIAFREIMFWLEGATEVRTGWIFDRIKVGRGFCIGFSLVDSSGTHTVSDGQLVLSLWSGSMSPLGTKGLRYAKNAMFHDEVDIKKSDFRWETFHNSAREWVQLSYVYRRTTPLLFVETDNEIRPHLWFRTNEGKMFYSLGDTCTWK